MKTIEDLLSLDIFLDAKIIAGHSGIKRNVSSIEISETPDIVNYISENSLLLTTGFAFKDNPKDLCKLITELYNYPCAGLGIKLKRFIHEIPQEVIDLANELEFPIIQTPDTQTLGAVSQNLMGFLWGDQTNDVINAIQVQKKFTEMMLKGYTLQSLIENLGSFLNSPVLLLNPLGDTTCYSRHFHLDKYAPYISLIENLFRNNIEEYRTKKEFFLHHPDKAQHLLKLDIFHLKTMHPYPYLLLIFNQENKPKQPSQLAIEQASSVLSFMLLKNEAINESSRLIENNFFGSLVDGNISSKEEILHRGQLHGLLKNYNYMCIVFKSDKEMDYYFKKNYILMNRTYDIIYDLFLKSVEEFNNNSILFMKDEYFVLIIQTKELFDHDRKELIRQQLLSFQNEALTKLNTSFSFGIGSFVNDVTYIPITYSEAVSSWTQGADIYQKKFINFYETKQLQELIRLLPEENSKEFYENTLRSLAYPNTKDEEDLLNTLFVFLEESCEITNTSKILYVHRNTVKYRIAKCEEILGYSVKDPQHSLNLRMALLMRTMFNKLTN